MQCLKDTATFCCIVLLIAVWRASQVDLQLESGEYFLSQPDRRRAAKAAEQAQQAERVAARQRQRQAAFVPPKVPPTGGSGVSEERFLQAERVVVRQRQRQAAFVPHKALPTNSSALSTDGCMAACHPECRWIADT